MKNYEPSDKFYTVLGVLAVIIGIVIYILTSGVLNGNDNKLDTNKEENNSSTNSPSLNDNLTNQDTNLDEDNNTSIDNSTANESLDNNQVVQPNNSNLKTTMTCTQTLTENSINTNTNCELEFENNLLLKQNCTTVMTSSSPTVLAAQFATTQIVLNSFNASTLDSSLMNSTLKYDEGKKITYTMFTDYKKIEENPDAILSDIELTLSSKNTKEEVKNILAKDKYVCK